MSKVTAKYQITIPPYVRSELGIVPGCEVDIRKEGDRYVLLVDPVAELKKNWRGKFKDKQSSDEYMNQIRGKVN
ncbi:MAG: AbrB/MazE/SpoVT family DNA-binding domain-containing protein [Desulfobacteraceae bacterium]